MRTIALAVGSLSAVSLLLGGCSGSDQGAEERGNSPAQNSPAASSPAGSPAAGMSDLRDRCASRLPDGAPVEPVVISGPQDSELVAAVFEAEGASTAMLLLPQTSGGLCGWANFATRAADAGVSSVAVDLCGYGDSICPEEMVSDAVGQVTAAAAYARESLGVSRIVVVGASMGGSQSVRAVAGGAPVDAWVDVSGPGTWDGDRLVALADRVSTPGLVVHSRSDGEAEYAEAKQLAQRTGARFVDGGQGHGWDLVATYEGRLTRIGRLIVRFAAD